jgi:hypothetical protein
MEKPQNEIMRLLIDLFCGRLILASKCVHLRIFHAWGCSLTEEVLGKFHRRCIVYHALTSRNTRAVSISTPDWKSMKARKGGVRRPLSGVQAKQKK